MNLNAQSINLKLSHIELHFLDRLVFINQNLLQSNQLEPSTPVFIPHSQPHFLDNHQFVIAIHIIKF